jgi:hypothetical protein
VTLVDTALLSLQLSDSSITPHHYFLASKNKRSTETCLTPMPLCCWSGTLARATGALFQGAVTVTF